MHPRKVPPPSYPPHVFKVLHAHVLGSLDLPPYVQPAGRVFAACSFGQSAPLSLFLFLMPSHALLKLCAFANTETCKSKLKIY